MDINSHRINEAYRYCQWITVHHYENFPVGSWLLPRQMRPFVSAIYAFARSADDFADEGKYKGKSLALLNIWREALRGCCGNGEIASAASRPRNDRMSGPRNDRMPRPRNDRMPRPRNDGVVATYHPIFLALADTVKRYDLPVQLCDDLLTAFTMDVTKKRYANWDELMTYCRYSANPVGRLVLRIFGYKDEKLFVYSDAICTGLQLANHWQDLAVDLKKDRLYIPQSILDRHGIAEEELFRHEAGPEFRLLMEDLVDRAHLLFDAGEPLLDHLRGRLRLELKLTLLGGRAILNRIQACRYDVFRHRPVLSPFSKLMLLSYALFS